MAVSKAMSAKQRRVVYGLNVAVTVVLALAVIGFALWAAGAYGGRVDLTREGRNSLSLRTVQLLRGLDQNLTITSLYSTALKEIRPYAEKHQKGVADLLDLYETAAGGNVATHAIDPSESPNKVTELLQRLAEKPAYKDEAKAHAEALDAFPGVGTRVVELVQSELGELEQLGTADPRVGEIREVATLQRLFQGIVQGAQEAETEARNLQAEEIPRYGRAVEVVTSYLRQVRSTLEDVQNWMTDNGASVPGIAAETKAVFEGAKQRYQPVIADVQKLLDETKDLERVKLEEVYEKLKRGQTVLVETDNEALVVTHDEIWPWRVDRNAPEPPDADPRDFAGEQAVSSAILKLTQKEKTAVVFTRFGGSSLLRADIPPAGPMMQMPEAPYQAINQLLQKENFITEEWDVQAQDEPPEAEDAARTIYVVVPPEPPEPPNRMRPTPPPPINAEQKQRIFDAAKASGMAVFLTHWSPPSIPYLPTPEKYEYNDYLKSNWGIEVVDTHLALEFTLNPQTEGLMVPTLASQRNAIISSNVFHYTAHTIGTPLRGLRAAFQAVAPLRLVAGEEKPEGVTVEPIVALEDTEDVWAVGNLNRLREDFKKRQGTKCYDDDVRASEMQLALAATNADGQRLVVFASDRFIANSVMNMGELVLMGGALRLAKLYPANADLFINALHWLTQEANRIAVGPRSSDVPRLEGLKDDSTLMFTRAFLVAIWPGLALLAGVGVWLLRRR